MYKMNAELISTSVSFPLYCSGDTHEGLWSNACCHLSITCAHTLPSSKLCSSFEYCFRKCCVEFLLAILFTPHTSASALLALPLYSNIVALFFYQNGTMPEHPTFIGSALCSFHKEIFLVSCVRLGTCRCIYTELWLWFKPTFNGNYDLFRLHKLCDLNKIISSTIHPIW